MLVVERFVIRSRFAEEETHDGPLACVRGFMLRPTCFV